MTASAVYGYDSFISSHSFTNLYVVDFLKYVKTGGKSLEEDTIIMNREDIENDDDSQTANQNDGDVSANSGCGQQARPIQERLCEEEGGQVKVMVVRDIDNYIHRG